MVRKRTDLVSCPTELKAVFHLSVVNHIWQGSIVQKNNENHDIDCKQSVVRSNLLDSQNF